MKTRLDFTYKGWTCWYNPLNGWGGLLSRAGKQMKLIRNCATIDELLEQITRATY